MIKALFHKMNDPRLILLADQGLMSAGGFVSNLLLAWSLGMASYGEYALVILTLTMVTTLVQSVFLMPAQVKYPKLSAHRKSPFISAAIIASVVTILLASSLASLLFSAMFPYEINPIIVISCGSIWLFFDLLRRFAVLVKPGKLIFGIDLMYVLSFCGLLFFVKPQTVSEALFMLAGASLINVSFLAIIPLQKPQGAILKYFKGHSLMSGSWLLPSAIVQWGSSNLLMMLAGWWVSSAMLGTLRLAQYIFGLLNIFLQAYEGYALPRISELVANARLSSKTMLQISWPFLLPVLLISLLTGFLFPAILPLIVQSPVEVHYSIPLGMVILYCCIVLVYPLRMLIRAGEHNRSYFLAHLFALIALVVLGPVLIHQWGVTGIVAGMIISQLIPGAFWFRELYLQHPQLWKLSTSH